MLTQPKTAPGSAVIYQLPMKAGFWLDKSQTCDSGGNPHVLAIYIFERQKLSSRKDLFDLNTFRNKSQAGKQQQGYRGRSCSGVSAGSISWPDTKYIVDSLRKPKLLWTLWFISWRTPNMHITPLTFSFIHFFPLPHRKAEELLNFVRVHSADLQSACIEGNRWVFSIWDTAEDGTFPRLIQWSSHILQKSQFLPFNLLAYILNFTSSMHTPRVYELLGKFQHGIQ